MSNVNDKHPFLDFFAGSGLVSLALHQDFSPVWANDICPKKCAVYEANHGSKHLNQASITEIQGFSLPKTVLSWASFPCQDLSLAGKIAGIKAGRSGLVWEWLRVMDEMAQQGGRPPIVVAENVSGLLSSNNGNNYHQLHAALQKRGYRVSPLLLNAIRWLPQSRPRVFVVGVKNNISLKGLTTDTPNWAHGAAVSKVLGNYSDSFYWNLPEPPARKKNLSDLINFDDDCFPDKKNDQTLRLIPKSHAERLKDEVLRGLRVAPGYKRIRNGQQVLELRFDDVAGCLRTPEGGSSRQFLILPTNGSGYKSRLVSVNEAARLMGADNYLLPGGYNAGYKAMGDAVAVPVAKYLSKHLLKPLADRI